MIEKLTNSVNGVVDALKTSPLMLVLLVMNGLGIGAGLWFLHIIATNAHDNMQLVLRACIRPINP